MIQAVRTANAKAPTWEYADVSIQRIARGPVWLRPARETVMENEVKAAGTIS